MSELAGPIARVLLRYVGAALIAKSGLQIDVNDPDVMVVVQGAIGGLLAAGAEIWWALARKYGWNS